MRRGKKREGWEVWGPPCLSGREGKMKGDSCPGSGRSSHLQSYSPASLSWLGTVLVPAMLRRLECQLLPKAENGGGKIRRLREFSRLNSKLTVSIHRHV